MADEPEEVQEITTICQGLNINIGTLHKSSIESMFLAGKKANELGHPVLLDPVGAGASTLRTQTAVKLMQEVRFSVIRGNMSEIKVLSGGMGGARGVDACETDIVTEETLEEAVAFVKAFAKSCGCIVAVTGAIDLVADDKRCYVIRNGRKEMGQITGTGCQLSGMLTAFCVRIRKKCWMRRQRLFVSWEQQVRSAGKICSRETAIPPTETGSLMRSAI